MRLPSTALVFCLSLASLSVLAGGCDSDIPDPQAQPRPNSVPDPAVTEPRSMVAFTNCQDLVGFAKGELQRELEELQQGPVEGGAGIPDFGGTSTGGGVPDSGHPGPDVSEPGAQDQSGSAPQDPDHSNTNNQTEGVDEPDIVKTDGQRLFTVTRSTLRIMSLDGQAAVLTDTIPLARQVGLSNVEMMIHQNRILIMFHEYHGVESQVRLIEIDATTPGQAKIVAQLSLQGAYVSSRRIGSVARIVLRTPARKPKFEPYYQFLTEARLELGLSITQESSPEVVALAKEKARVHNNALIAQISEKDILPTYRLEQNGALVAQGVLYGCEHTMRPGLASGIDTLSVLSVDLDAALTPVSAAGVLAKGSTVYSSLSSLYVATRPVWAGGPSTGAVQTTYIHKFDISDPKKAVYQASGAIDGELLNQFAMSEHQGVLRVAATRSVLGNGQDTESFVATLQNQGNLLEELGRASGLGKTENIRSVRFMGDVGYVVTFRQTDPLYTLDLKDPAAPTVLGELKIDGYSAYLHPLAPGYLLGVGRDADPNTGQPRGMQISIFDVRDLRAPKRIHNYVLPGAESLVDREHRAFLYWPKTKTLALPVSFWNFKTEDGVEDFQGAILYDVDIQTGIQERTRFRHPKQPPEKSHHLDWYTMIQRVLVAQDTLWTVSEAGVMGSGVQNGEQKSWLAYP